MSINKNRRPENKNNNPNPLIYGKHAAIAALKNPERKILRLVITKPSLAEVEKENPEVLKQTKPHIADNNYIESMLPKGSVHQGIVVEARPLAEKTLEDVLDNSKILLILDQVTDPHNVGAILRSAAAFNVGGVITTRDNSPIESGTLAKAASGTLEIIPLVKVANLANAMKILKDNNFWCIGLDGYAKTELSQIPDYEKVALVLGAEGKGLRRLTGENCDLLVKLPISENVESLNVSNAAAISLYEINRKLKT